MVKFGKFLRAEKLEEWTNNYIDYKSLKHFISQLKEKISKDEDQENNLEFDKNDFHIRIRSPSDSDKSTKKMFNDLNEEIPPSSLNMEEHFKKFTKMLDEEIKKIYFFFVNRERELYVSINSHLHIRQNYDTFNLQLIEREIQELNKISLLTQNVSKFLNMNMRALKKILKKFDKNFGFYFGKISLNYIQKKIECKNSDLLYILQFKIIDEASAIIEDLMSELRKNFEIKQSNMNNINKTDVLLPQTEFNFSYRDLISSINRNILELEDNILLIDEENQNFRNNFKDWSNYLKQNIKNYGQTNDTSLCGVSIRDKLGYGKIGGMIRTFSSTNESQFSQENSKNIHLTLIHTFFFMFCFSIVLPTNIYFIKSLNYKPMLSGIIMACTPIGTLISLFPTNKWIKSSYKNPITVSLLFILIGNALYILSSVFQNITPMIIGRVFLGVGGNRVANRNYIIEFIPKSKLSRYLLYFQLCSLTGLAGGCLISIVFLYLSNSDADLDFYLNDYTYPSWLCLFISFLLLIFVFFYFTEPLQSNFSICEDLNTTQNDNATENKSNSKITQTEKKMIDEIDDKLSEINDMNKFSDTNLVARSIEQIAWKEKKTTAYLYKCFFVFIFILVICRLTSESLLVISPYYIHDLDNDFDNKGIALLMSSALFLVIPVGFFFNIYLDQKVKDRKMIIYLLFATIIFNFFILNLFYTSIPQYCVFFVLLIISANLLENTATTMFSKIIPSDYELLSLNNGVIIQVSTTVGRILGSSMLTIAGLGTDEKLNLITYGITIVLFVICLITTILFYSNLRVKAIARILRNRSLRKLKASEF